jgi:hypothetical protein
MSALADLCKKFKFYVFMLLDLSGVPLTVPTLWHGWHCLKNAIGEYNTKTADQFFPNLEN